MIGTTLQNRYRLDAKLGQGGMGVVYRARDTLLDRDVAVKVLSHPGLGTEGHARLLREARAAAQLNHPNIVAVHDAGEFDNSPFIVMELVEGESLRSRPPASLDGTLAVARQVCAALDHAHTHGLVHRDLKPENILMTAEGTAKLVDFGLARSAASQLTMEGALVGTVSYMAPEQALGQALDGRADLYALGVMLYELTAGRLPFTADDPIAVISQHLNAPVVPPRAHNPALPTALEALILRLLSKSPEGRPASAAEGLRDLERLDLAQAAPAEEIPLLDWIVRGRLVGRERELAEARQCWGRAVGGAGQVLLVSGEPGIGKTRLVRELATVAEVMGGRVLAGECYAEGGAPYAPIGQIVRQALGSHFELDLPDLVLADLLGLAPDLRRRYPDVLPNPALDAQSEQQRLFESVVAWCEALAEQAPLLLLLDDVHWADSGTLGLLRHLARRLRRRRVLLVATFREVELDEARPLHQVLLDLNRERLATRLKLARLGQAATGEMLRALFAEEITPQFVAGIYRETEGSPFFVEEVCKALVESGQVYFDEGRWRRPSMEELEIPLSVRLAIQARVGRLPEAAQEALLMAAILGREFDYETLRSASGLEEAALLDALEAAERAQLVEEVRGGGGEVFSFAHALIPSTLREGVSGLRRRRLHRRAAQAVESVRPEDYEALAYQYAEAGEEAKARQYHVRAADRALAAYANAEAAGYYRSALELSGPEQERARLLTDLGRVLSRQGGHAEAIRFWREALELYREQGEADQAAHVYARMGRATWDSGDTAGGLAVCREGLDVLGEGPDGPGLARLLHETARAHFFNGQTEAARQLGLRALAMAERLGEVEVQADTLATLGVLPGQSGDDMRRTVTQAIELAEAAGLLRIAARAHNNLAVILVPAGEFRQAREHFERLVELESQRGARYNRLFGLANVGLTLTLLGEFAAAAEALEAGREIRDTVGGESEGARLHDAARAFYTREFGQLTDAIRMWRESLASARRLGDLTQVNQICWRLGDALMEIGQLEEAGAVLEELVSAGDLPGEETWPYHVISRSLLCAVRAAQGQTTEARRWLDEAHEKYGMKPVRFADPCLEQAEARLAAVEGRWGEAVEAFEKTAEAFGGMGMRWYRAQTLREWAEAHLARGQAGDLEQARALLGEARAAFEAMGVSHYAGLVSARLEALPAGSE